MRMFGTELSRRQVKLRFLDFDLELAADLGVRLAVTTGHVFSVKPVRPSGSAAAC